jgi:glutathione S-transferase
MTVRIFHIEGRRSHRVIWLCEELGIPYEAVFVVGDIMRSWGGIRAARPQMPTAPTVEYDGALINESGAIVDILLAREGKGRLVPAVTSPDFLLHTQWMHFAEGTAMARMVTDRMVSIAAGIEVNAVPGYRPGDPLDKIAMVGTPGVFDFIESHLADHPYFGGSSFSAADIMMHYPIRTAKLIAWIDPRAYPRIAQWRDRVEQRPAFARTEAAANPGGADEHGLPLGQPHPFPAPSDF